MFLGLLLRSYYTEVTLKYISTNFIVELSKFPNFPFSKKNQYLVNGESNQKIVTSKKDAELNSGPNPPH